MRKRKRRRQSLRNISPFYNRKIARSLRKIGEERGEKREEKVFQVLRRWRDSRVILYYEESQKKGYYDQVGIDGWFMNRRGEMIEFQIKSSFRAAREHLEKHPDIPVIVVEDGEKLDALDQKMRKIFQNELSDNEQV